MNQKTRNPFDVLSDAYGDFTRLHHEMWRECARSSFSANTKNEETSKKQESEQDSLEAPEVLHKLHAFQSPLTIFEPHIVQEALTRASLTLHQKLEKDPARLQHVAVTHFEKQQALYLKTFDAMLRDEMSQGDSSKHSTREKFFPERSETFLMKLPPIQGKDSHKETPTDFSTDPKEVPPPTDRRFSNPMWDSVPYFSFLKESYLLYTDFIQNMVSELDGLDASTQHKMNFYVKQLVDALSPSNYAATNPDVLQATLETGGENLKRGVQNFLSDMQSGHVPMTDMNAFEVGKDLATTPGTVIFRNDILELIHYKPQTEKVFETPLLIIPAWINKFYIFDLTPDRSFVRWALSQGLQVFMISWVNPNQKHKDFTFSDYILKGLYAAVEATLKRTKAKKINAYGYCAGGVLLNCLMAYMKEKKIKSPFASATTLAAPMDASKSGDLLAYICDKQIKILEDRLKTTCIIPGSALLHSFNLLKPKDLMWQHTVHNYLMGKTPTAFDMLYWNCDSMNLVGKMHTQYLREVFLNNNMLKKGAITLEGAPINLRKITTPSFIVGAIKDHITPWESLFPLIDTVSSKRKEFLLTGSGHVAGIMNHPSLHKYQHWVNPSQNMPALEWKKEAKEHKGSWWGYWLNWIEPYKGKSITSPVFHSGLSPAPGAYVMEKFADALKAAD